MQVLRWSAAAALAAMVGLTPSFASDELSSMKASMDNMKIEMEAMRSQMAAEREALRANAGGAPEGLTSAKGNATIRIGGDVRVQYQLGTGSGYGRQGYTDYANNGTPGTDNNFRSAKAGWNVARAQLKFDVDLSCDTKGFISLRFDEAGSYGYRLLDNAFWKWSNIGGTGLSLTVGLQDMPFGMCNNTDMGGYDFAGVDRPLITDPFVRSLGNLGYVNAGFNGNALDMAMLNGFNSRNVTHLGAVAAYNFDDQLTLKAGIMAAGINNATLSGRPDGVDQLTYDNQIRNIGFVDHVVALGWNPCWIDGLHLEASYMGTFDNGMNGQLDGNGFVNNNPYAHIYTQSAHGDTSYRPSFDLGASYKINDQWKAYAEACMTWNPYYSDGYSFALTAGVDYRMTEKLMFGIGADWMHLNYTGDTLFLVADANGNYPNIAGNGYNANLYRLNLGAKYDFGNGIYFQAQYYHDMCYLTGIRDQDMKHADTILFQTGYQF